MVSRFIDMLIINRFRKLENNIKMIKEFSFNDLNFGGLFD